jgi:hypothetical protein
MAITTNAVSVTGPLGSHIRTPATPWQINASSADASGCEEIQAAPGAGYHLCISRLVIGIGAAITVDIGAGESGSACQTVLIGAIGGAAGTYILDFRDRPILLAENKSLTVDASDAGVVNVYVEGFTRAK